MRCRLDQLRGVSGEPDGGLNRFAVVVESVDRQREPQGQPASAARQVIGVVGRVPFTVRYVDHVQIGGVLGVSCPGEFGLAIDERTAVKGSEKPLVWVEDERVGLLDAGVLVA